MLALASAAKLVTVAGHLRARGLRFRVNPDSEGTYHPG
jgi:hypothetical protein